MQLLFKRINSKNLVQALEEQSVWALLENRETFLEGVSLLARWVQALLRAEGMGRGVSLLNRSPCEQHGWVPCSGDPATVACVLDSGLAVECRTVGTFIPPFLLQSRCEVREGKGYPGPQGPLNRARMGGYFLVPDHMNNPHSRPLLHKSDEKYFADNPQGRGRDPEMLRHLPLGTQWTSASAPEQRPGAGMTPPSQWHPFSPWQAVRVEHEGLHAEAVGAGAQGNGLGSAELSHQQHGDLCGSEVPGPGQGVSRGAGVPWALLGMTRLQCLMHI